MTALSATSANAGSTNSQPLSLWILASTPSMFRNSLHEAVVGVEPRMGRIEADEGAAGGDGNTIVDQQLDAALSQSGFDDPVTAGIAYSRDADRQACLGQGHELRTHADLQAQAVEGAGRCVLDLNAVGSDIGRPVRQDAR